MGSHQRKDSVSETGRNPDGTFTKGSAAASEAGHLGGLHSHDHDGLTKEEKVSELEVQDVREPSFPLAKLPARDCTANDARQDTTTGRNADGTFTKGSAAAKEAGHLGGLHSHQHEGDVSDSPSSALHCTCLGCIIDAL